MVAASRDGGAHYGALRADSTLVDPANNADKPLPNVIANSFGWASFMFVSTNPRYQLVNGLERVISGMCPPAVSKASSLVIRTGNNLIGGATWVRHFFR